MIFEEKIQPETTHDQQVYLFVYRGPEILVQAEGDNIGLLPPAGILRPLVPENLLYIGELDGIPCYCREEENTLSEESGVFVPLRGLFGKLDDQAYRAVCLGYQLYHWRKNQRFCGRCGKPAMDSKLERARVCSGCGLVVYPRISPAVIMSVVRDDEILLARSGRFPNTKMYSVLAGYVEPGETLEECVMREVYEETRIRVRNIRYFGSQPWPFSQSLMVGFTAEYASGGIRVDETEIVDAAWFTKDNLPLIPRPGSIARRLVDAFILS